MADESMAAVMEDLWLAERAQAAADPNSWQQTSVSLIYGAMVLWARHQTSTKTDLNSLSDATFPTFLGDVFVGRAAFFLLATGTEAALKSIAVTSNASLPFDTTSQFSSGHNLVALARNHCNLSPTSAEEKMLKRLEHWITWAGRYPTPRVDKVGKPPKIGFAVEDISDLPESVDPQHWQEALAFVTRLLNLKLDEAKR